MSTKGGKSLKNMEEIYSKYHESSSSEDLPVQDYSSDEGDLDTKLASEIAASKLFSRKRKQPKDNDVYRRLAKLDRARAKLLEEALHVKKKRPMTKWNLALKRWNVGKNSFQIPRKGTEDYDQVKKIMELL